MNTKFASKRSIAIGVSLIVGLVVSTAWAQLPRTITLDTNANSGVTNLVSVRLNAQGSENAVGFSLSFDNQLLQFVGATLGTGAPGASMNVNSSQAANGVVGVAVAMPIGQSFAAGTRECVRFSFAPAGTNSGTSFLTFTDSPIVREVSDDTANTLSATFVDSSVAVIVPPVITGQPASQTVLAGASATFSVVASGTSPFGYQWRKDGLNISGATNSTYTRSGISSADVGSYSVAVTNIGGPATSSDATLNVFVPQLTAILADTNNNIRTTWSCLAGVSYSLEFKSNLLDLQWTALTNTTALSSSLTFTDGPGSLTQRFYRLNWATGFSSPAGFIKIPLAGNSDTYVSVPFVRPAVASASMSSVSGNTVSVRGSPNWVMDQFVYSVGVQTNTYYMRFTSGTLEGRTYPITGNGSNTLNVNLGIDNLTGAAVNDTLVIEPYWTMATVFPGGGGVNISPTVGNRNTEVLTPDVTGSGINLSSAKIYYFHNGVWKILGQGNTDHGTDPLSLNSHFIVRHNVATNTTLVALGAVVGSKVAIPFRSSGVTRQDNAIGLVRPLTLSLDESQLVSSGSFASSPLPGTRTDELLVFDNFAVQHNKSASAVYYYWNSAWRRVGSGSTVVGADKIFSPGAGVIIRKTTNNAPTLWINTPGY